MSAYSPEAFGLGVGAAADTSWLSTAKYLFRDKSYLKAALAFERAGFKATDAASRAVALIGKAECLKQLRQFDAAEEALSRIEYGSLEDSLTAACRYQAAVSSYLAGHFPNAESQLQQLYFTVRDSSLTRPALFLYGLILNEQGKWVESREKIRAAIRSSRAQIETKDSMARRIDELYDPVNFPRLKEERKARRLSMVIPGSGQIYCGYWGEGLASFSLNAAAVAFVGYNLFTRYYVTTFTVGSMVMQMFYAGGIERSGTLAGQANIMRMSRYNAQLKNAIIGLEYALSQE